MKVSFENLVESKLAVIPLYPIEPWNDKKEVAEDLIEPWNDKKDFV